ncbi:MAG: MFS transporter [Bacteroidota bacterium]|nr:MFS transporter [Bacteroidota bacterium]
MNHKVIKQNISCGESGPFKLKGSSLRGLAGTTIGFFVGFASVALYGPTAVKFREAMDLSPFLVGLLVAFPSLSGSLLRIPFGAWVDTSGGRKPFLVLLVLSLLGLGGVTMLLNLTYPDNMHGLYWLVLLSGLLSGCGIATFSAGIAQTSYWFPRKKQGFALGAYAGLGNLAPGLFSLILPFYLQRFGFISAYFAWFLFLLTGTVLYAVIGINSYYFQLRKAGKTEQQSRAEAFRMGQELFPSGNVRASLLNSARSGNTWSLMAVYFTTFGGFIALTAWFPTYWNELHGFVAVKAGIYTAVFSLLASLFRVIGGKLSDKYEGEPASLVSLVIVLISSCILTFSGSPAFCMTAVILLAIGMGVTNAAVFKLVPYYIPDAVGGAAGWIGGLGAFGGFIIPPVMGIIADKFGKAGYSAGFAVFIFLSVINIFIVYKLYMTKKESVKGSNGQVLVSEPENL